MRPPKNLEYTPPSNHRQVQGPRGIGAEKGENGRKSLA